MSIMPNTLSKTPRAKAPLTGFAKGEVHAAKLLNQIASILPQNGHDDPKRDARYLLALAMTRTSPVLPHENIHLDDQSIARLNDFIARRCRGEPISRMRGRREFYGLDFVINPATLDPRADSEIIVETVLDYAQNCNREKLRIADFGTGSGCLLLAALAHLPHAVGFGTDIQPQAITIASTNAERLGLADRATFSQTSWDQGLGDKRLGGRFDIIICNPPYIPQKEIPLLMDEVKHYDPLSALDGGHDGLDAFRELAPIFNAKLAQDGVAIVEIGQGQLTHVTEIMAQQHLKRIEKRGDLAGITRALVFEKKEK